MADTETSMVERVARAMEEAEFGYSMDLIRLVDGISTYRLTYSDGTKPLEFDSTDDAYAHISEKKRHTQARAAIEAMRFAEDGSDCPEHVRIAGEDAYHENGDARAVFNAVLDAALEPKE